MAFVLVLIMAMGAFTSTFAASAGNESVEATAWDKAIDKLYAWGIIEEDEVAASKDLSKKLDRQVFALWTAKILVKEFGENILRLVQKESEDKSKSWHERKQTTINHLKKESADVQMICFADKLSNLRSIYRDKLDIGEKIWDRFNATKEDEYWYYKSILDETSGSIKLMGLKGVYCIDEYEILLQEVFEK
jgi:hypothetical protein